ncbi:MAG: hypothetical protein WCJ19_02835 [bacterium]
MEVKSKHKKAKKVSSIDELEFSNAAFPRHIKVAILIAYAAVIGAIIITILILINMIVNPPSSKNTSPNVTNTPAVTITVDPTTAP